MTNLYNLKFVPELASLSCMKHMHKGEIILKKYKLEWTHRYLFSY